MLSLLRLLFTGSLYKKSPLEPDGPDEKLEGDVRRDLSFLFTEHGARIVSNSYYPRSFGNAIIVIPVRDLFLEVVRDRGSLCVCVGRTPPGPSESPWTDSRLAVASLEMKESGSRIPDIPSYATLSRAAAILEPAFSLLEEAYSAPNYEPTMQKIKAINKASRKKLEEEITKNSKPSKPLA